jgi:PAS domain S-box-containing protein
MLGFFGFRARQAVNPVAQRRRQADARKIPWQGFAVMVATCLVLLGLEIYQAVWNASELKRGRERIVDTFEVIAIARGLERGIRDTELNQRNFVITGDAAYLEPYRAQAQKVRFLLSELKRLTAGHAGQLLSLQSLDAQIGRRLAELEEVTRTRERDGLQAAIRLMRTNLAVNTARSIDELIDATVVTEDALLEKRLAAVAGDERITAITAGIAGALTAAIMGLGFMLMLQAVRRIRRSGDAQRKSEENFRLLVNSVTDYAIYTLDPQGRVTSWNAGAAQIKGYADDEIIGQHFSRFFTEDDRRAGAPQRALEIAARDGKFETEAVRVRKDGTRFWAHVVIDSLCDPSGRLLGFVKITRDITERRKQQETLEATRAALAQSQKMEALGQLTGGVAHDFNNLLTVITGAVDMLQRRLQTGERDVGPFIDTARRGVDRAAALTRQLLAFSRRQPLEPKPLILNDLLAGVAGMLRRTLGEGIAIETDLADGLWGIAADANQLENAILNLAVNARDAMPRGGKLTIESANVQLDEGYAATHDDLAPGDYAMVAVSDTGSGMTREVVAKAFEPFFTTKDLGKGTGLGLAQVYGFIKQSRGHANIYSEPGVGTTVKLYLPRLDAPPAAKRPAATRPAAVALREETILVVEDDEDVRAFTTQALRDLGYRVLVATDAQSALETLEKEAGIDLLFTDIGLAGGINGRQLADAAQRRWPQLKVLFTSGYTRNVIIHNGRLDPGIELLSKPFNQAALAEKIRVVLARGDGAAG